MNFNRNKEPGYFFSVILLVTGIIGLIAGIDNILGYFNSGFIECPLRNTFYIYGKGCLIVTASFTILGWIFAWSGLYYLKKYFNKVKM